MEQYKLYINGKWTESSGDEKKEVINPATEEIIAEITYGTKEDTDTAVAAAKTAFPAWNALALEERIEYIQKIADGIRERKKELIDSVIAELGSSRSFTDYSQVERSADEMEAYIDSLSEIEFEEQIKNARVVKEGVGVVAAITPWNFPLNQIQRKISPALLAGNTVVVKPASDTPITAMILTEIIDEAGLPEGVFNLLTGSGSDLGDYLAGHPDVGLISFTGSTEVGKGLYSKAQENVKKLVLEMGGKSALIYLENGDLDLAVKKSVDTVTNNSGQACSALTRLLVPASQLSEVEDAVVKYVETLKVGDPNDEDTVVGPLVSETQQKRVLDYIEKGKEEGANILVGGNALDRTGYFIEPTVFTNVTNDMTIAREEIFGPVLVIITYDSVEDAIQIANDSPYGLSGAVVGPVEEAEKVALQMRTGNILINEGSSNPYAPFGGYKESGLGREVGRYGIEDYLETKAILK